MFYRLKEQRERVDREHQEETEQFHQTNRELNTRIDGLQSQLDEKQVSLRSNAM